MRAERRRHAEQDGVGLGELFGIGGRLELAIAGEALEELGAEVFDVGATHLEGVDLALVDVEPEHREAAIEDGLGQGQSDVPETDDADHRSAVLDLFTKGGGGRHHGGSSGAHGRCSLGAIRGGPRKNSLHRPSWVETSAGHAQSSRSRRGFIPVKGKSHQLPNSVSGASRSDCTVARNAAPAAPSTTR